MSDKTQLEQIAELLVGHCFMPPDHDLDTGDMELEMARNVAQQILGICQPQWIPVSEGLPVFGDKYLTLLNNGQIHILTWVAAYWTDHYTTVTNVTHWMPLPEDTA